MTANDIQIAIIDALTLYAGFPVIESDQDGDRPEGTHSVFTWTMDAGKDIGRPDYMLNQSYAETMTEGVRFVLSFTAVAGFNYLSQAAAHKVRDWFRFIGEEVLDAAGVVVVDVTDIGNRNSVDEDERRNGFDVFMRSTRTLTKNGTFIEFTGISGEIIL